MCGKLYKCSHKKFIEKYAKTKETKHVYHLSIDAGHLSRSLLLGIAAAAVAAKESTVIDWYVRARRATEILTHAVGAHTRTPPHVVVIGDEMCRSSIPHTHSSAERASHRKRCEPKPSQRVCVSACVVSIPSIHRVHIHVQTRMCALWCHITHKLTTS